MRFHSNTLLPWTCFHVNWTECTECIALGTCVDRFVCSLPCLARFQWVHLQVCLLWDFSLLHSLIGYCSFVCCLVSLCLVLSSHLLSCWLSVCLFVCFLICFVSLTCSFNCLLAPLSVCLFAWLLACLFSCVCVLLACWFVCWIVCICSLVCACLLVCAFAFTLRVEMLYESFRRKPGWRFTAGASPRIQHSICKSVQKYHFLYVTAVTEFRSGCS